MTIVTVVTINMGAGAVPKIPSQPSQQTMKEMKIERIVRTAFGACVATPSSKYGKALGRAHVTLQLQDESVIVGYYTLPKVQNPSAAAEKMKGGIQWQETTGLTVHL